MSNPYPSTGAEVMREIKFRAWDVQAKRLYQPRCIEYTPGGGNWLLGENEYDASGSFVKRHDLPILNADNPESAFLMQYTGREDAKGREIYKKDILKIAKDGNSIKAIVLFEEGAFVVSSPLLAVVANLGDMLQTTTIEVIGNAYENPELFKSKGGML